MQINKTIKNNKLRIEVVKESTDLEQFRSAIDTIRESYGDQRLSLDAVAVMVCSPNNSGRSLQYALQGKREIAPCEFIAANYFLDKIKAEQ